MSDEKPPPEGEGSDTNSGDAETLQIARDVGRAFVDFYDRALQRVTEQIQRIDAILATDVNESVQRAAGHVRERLSDSLGNMRWKRDQLEQAGKGIEGASRVIDVLDPVGVIVNEMKHDLIDSVRASLDEQRVDVDAIEFAATAAHEAGLRKVSDAMGRILGAVTELRGIGFQVGEIQATVEDFINLRTQYDFSLLAPVISDSDTKGTKRNKRSIDKQRERLLAEDKWVLRFLNDFWFKYWQLAFEQSLPDADHETNIVVARDVIPIALDRENEPMDVRYLCSVVWGIVRDQRRDGSVKSLRVRIRDGHIVEALSRLVQTATSEPLDVVELEGDLQKYWTRLPRQQR